MFPYKQRVLTAESLQNRESRWNADTFVSGTYLSKLVQATLEKYNEKCQLICLASQ